MSAALHWLDTATRVLSCEWVARRGRDGWCETHDDPWPCGRAQEAADMLAEELDQPTKEQKMGNEVVSADRLREAARVLRERAEGATPGPWQCHEDWAPVTAGSDSVFHGYYSDKCPACSEEIRDDAEVSISVEDRDYIATMHPGVGLALADWLDCQADTTCDCGVDESALVLADLILGAES